MALRRTRMALRPIACNAADPYSLGDEPYPPNGALSPEEVAHVNTHFPLFRIAVVAAAVLFTVLVVHAAMEGIFLRYPANVLAALG